MSSSKPSSCSLTTARQRLAQLEQEKGGETHVTSSESRAIDDSERRFSVAKRFGERIEAWHALHDASERREDTDEVRLCEAHVMVRRFELLGERSSTIATHEVAGRLDCERRERDGMFDPGRRTGERR